MIELFPFQQTASSEIAEKYQEFISDPDRPRLKGYGPLPFYQALHALTGSGKTPMLADAVSQMRLAVPVQPIVLWISKAKVIVEQTFLNFSDGGKYRHFVENFQVRQLNDISPKDIVDNANAVILLGTVATFNSKERGDRRIFGVREDYSDKSVWDTLIERKNNLDIKRPLIIVYDEGHNLTDQQSNLLMELKPEAIVLASATPRLPGKMGEIIDLLKINGYTDSDLTTQISSKDVIDCQLIKKEINLGGYVTAEEVAISAMLEDRDSLVEACEKLNLEFTPKCIYVCKTNIKGDEQKPFHARQAPPIKIWRYLVEDCDIDPEKIAVYCDLHTNKSNPLPEDFILFNGGDSDYDEFINGNFEHIIFNLSLQEGWDDPSCYFAYIDKSMGSELQIEQIIGRVLRQPAAMHYPDARLNSASFYVHVDGTGVFLDILKHVKSKLADDLPVVEIRNAGINQKTLETLQPKKNIKILSVNLDTSIAASAVEQILDEVSEYLNSPDIFAPGMVANVTHQIGESANIGMLDWSEQGQSMAVTVKWLLGRYISKQYPEALMVCDMTHPRFNRPIQLGSRAAKQIESQANSIVHAFLEHASLITYPWDEVEVSVFVANSNDKHRFENSVHEYYSDMNADEISCAYAIDALGWPWCRNPSNGGFSIPLLELGNKRRFFPDFVVWTDKAIWLIDPKGEHLIERDAGRKLVAVDNYGGSIPIKVCLITQGDWDKSFNKRGNDGVTAWRLRAGSISPARFASYNNLLGSVVGLKGDKEKHEAN